MTYYIVASYISIAGFIYGYTHGHSSISSSKDIVLNTIFFLLSPISVIFLIGTTIGYIHRNFMDIHKGFEDEWH